VVDDPSNRVDQVVVHPSAPLLVAGVPSDGLDVSASDLDELLRVDTKEWKAELPPIEEHFATFGERLPSCLGEELEALRLRLG
jgi:phosphoenolpyruvate carboxykinase (GTP)